MSSRQRHKAAQRNGAKAAGSKSPQGIQNSSMNAIRHGLTAQTLVLSNESPAKFDHMLQSYIARFKPADEIELNLVDEMVAARWRQQRGWMIQTVAINLEMASQQVDIKEHEAHNASLAITEPARVTLAFTAMANQEKTLELIMRYETSYSRIHERAMKTLMRLQEARLKEEARLREEARLQEEARSQADPIQNEPVHAAESKSAPVSGPAIPTTCAPIEPETQNLRNDAKPEAPRPPIAPIHIDGNPPSWPTSL